MSLTRDEAIERWRSDAGRAFLERLREEGRPWMLDRTVAIYTLVDGGVPVLHGSGILLRIADANFLLSAAHVLEEGADEDTLLLVTQGTPGSGFVPLSGVEIQHTENKEDVDI